MVTDAQVRLLRQKMSEGKTQEAASAAAGMSVRSGRTCAHTAHRDHPDRSIVITAIGHGDRGRSEATGVLGYLALA